MLSKKLWWMIAVGVAVAVLVVSVVLLTLPKAPPSQPTSEPSSSAVDVLAEHPDDAVTFTSIVYNLIGDSPLVSVNGMLCRVSSRMQTDEPVPTMAIGDVIEVVYDGRIAESYPGQINFVYAIRKIEGEHPPLTYAFTPKPSAQKTRTDVVGNVYYYGLDGMDVTVEDITMDLGRALQVGVVSPEYMLVQAERDASAGKATLVEYKDGGSMLYRYEHYAILKMNTIAGDTSLYIGSADLTIAALEKSQKNDVPLLKIVASQNKPDTPIRVSTWRTAMMTDYIMYFADVDSVQVKTDDGYQDILDAVHSGKTDIDTLRSELWELANADGSQAQVICGDGLSDGVPYTTTTMRFKDFNVIFTGYQDRREVLFASPKGGGFSRSVKQRIAEESADYPLTVKKSASAKIMTVTRSEWKQSYDVCYYNIDSAAVTVNGKQVDLLEAVSQGELSFEQLLTDADSLGNYIYNTHYKDGGSVLYRFENYAFLKRNTLKGDKTLYIGTPDLTPNVI